MDVNRFLSNSSVGNSAFRAETTPSTLMKNATKDPCPGYGTDFDLPIPWQYVYGAACAVISIMGTAGNAAVIWICLYYGSMRTITNFFIANLALADLLLSLVNVPLTSYFVLTQFWIFGDVCCTLVNFIASTTVVASVFTMMCISIDR